jgi:integrase
MVVFKVKNVKKATNPNGQVYYYDRVTGKRIKAEFGTSAFLDEIEELRANHDPAPAPTSTATIGGLIHGFKTSPEWARLAPRTKTDYDKIFNYMKPVGGTPSASLDPPRCTKIRNKAFEKHKKRFANYVIAVMSRLYNWGIPNGYTKSNPWEKVETIKPSLEEKLKQANRPWSEAELEAVLEKADPGMRLAVALGAFTSIREGDVIRLPWSSYDGQVIIWAHHKTAKPIYIPAQMRLRELLDEAKEDRKSTIIVTGKRGRPYATESGFRSMFFRMIGELERAGEVGPGLTYHGLRHSIATRLADEGADTRTIMAITGHLSESSVKRYTQTADQKRRAMAGIALLERPNGNDE